MLQWIEREKKLEKLKSGEDENFKIPFVRQTSWFSPRRISPLAIYTRGKEQNQWVILFG